MFSVKYGAFVWNYGRSGSTMLERTRSLLSVYLVEEMPGNWSS
jgi:hypothetical protein